MSWDLYCIHYTCLVDGKHKELNFSCQYQISNIKSFQEIVTGPQIWLIWKEVVGGGMRAKINTAIALLLEMDLCNRFSINPTQRLCSFSYLTERVSSDFTLSENSRLLMDCIGRHLRGTGAKLRRIVLLTWIRPELLWCSPGDPSRQLWWHRPRRTWKTGIEGNCFNIVWRDYILPGDRVHIYYLH